MFCTPFQRGVPGMRRTCSVVNRPWLECAGNGGLVWDFRIYRRTDDFQQHFDKRRLWLRRLAWLAVQPSLGLRMVCSISWFGMKTLCELNEHYMWHWVYFVFLLCCRFVLL